MHPVLKRIALNGLLTALVLGLIGLAFAELGSILLGGSTGRTAAVESVAPPPAADPVKDALRSRVPLMMALWGFLFVAVGEGVLYLLRGGRTSAATNTTPTVIKPDPAEVLLEELLRQVEAAQANPPAESPPVPEHQGPAAPNLRESAPSPSTTTAENSPTPELVPGERGA
ncbi:MAG: hypothetical protein JWO38_4837 [Gemmataceae bacterium]|nr:hypothetical protein [Gemmataceae bacterium]